MWHHIRLDMNYARYNGQKKTGAAKSNDHILWDSCSATECAAGGLRGRRDFKAF